MITSNAKIKQLLKDLGLTKNQIGIYLALAKQGHARAGVIIKQTGLHRNIVYSVLEELIYIRLVSSSKSSGILMYRINDPERMVIEQEEKLKIAKDAKELISEYAATTTPQQIIIYEGQKDFVTQARRAYDRISKNGTIRLLGISPVWHDLVGDKIGDELIDIYRRKNIKSKALAKKISEKDKKYIVTLEKYLEGKETPLVSDDTTGIEILEDRISIRSFVEPYFIVEIINPQLAKNYQKYFDFIWDSTK